MAIAPFLASVAQAAPIAFDLTRTLAKVDALTSDAAHAGSKLVVFPEAFVGAYPKGADFGARVGSRSEQGRRAYRNYFEAAIDVPGPAIDELSETARRHAVHLVIGVIERVGATLFCSVVFFDDDGRYLGVHRKLMPTGSERLIWGCGDGSTLPVFDTALGRVGAVICWENYMPLLRMSMYDQHIELYCAPTVDARETWTPTMQHVAMEGRCFVLSANQFARRCDYPKQFVESLESDDDVLIAGGSCIVSPLGELLAGPLRGEEGVLTTQIDRRRIAEGKFDFDVVGHYARPDVFRLDVDGRPRAPVHWRQKDEPRSD